MSFEKFNKLVEEWDIVIKLIFFFLYGGLGSINPFLGVIIKSKDISKTLVGILMSLTHLIGFFTQQFWAFISDRFQQHRVVYISLVTGTIITVVGLFLVRALWLLFIVVILYSFIQKPLIPLLDAQILAILAESSHKTSLVTEDGKDEAQRKQENRMKYGRNRAFATLSYGIVTLTSGILAGNYGLFIFGIFSSVYLTISIFMGFKLPKSILKKEKPKVNFELQTKIESDSSSANLLQKESETEIEIFNDSPPDQVIVLESLERKKETEKGEGEGESNPKESLVKNEELTSSDNRSYGKKLLSIFTPITIVMWITIFIINMTFLMINAYLLIYIHELGNADSLMGIMVACAIIFEIPFFFFSSSVLKKLGIYGMLILSQSLLIIRVFSYSFLQNPWFVLFIEPLHGIAFGSYWTATILYASSIAPKGLEATTQSIFSGLSTGLGGFFGSLLAGILYENYGGVVMFRVFGASLISSLLFFSISFPILKKRQELKNNIIH